MQFHLGSATNFWMLPLATHWHITSTQAFHFVLLNHKIWLLSNVNILPCTCTVPRLISSKFPPPQLISSKSPPATADFFQVPPPPPRWLISSNKFPPLATADFLQVPPPYSSFLVLFFPSSAWAPTLDLLTRGQLGEDSWVYKVFGMSDSC